MGLSFYAAAGGYFALLCGAVEESRCGCRCVVGAEVRVPISIRLRIWAMGMGLQRACAAIPGLATAERVQHDTDVRATVLHYAVGAGYLDIVCSLLERGADPRPYSNWLVRFCIWRDQADILKVLLDAGLDPTMAELPRSGLTNSDLIALLSSHGVDCDPNRAEDG